MPPSQPLVTSSRNEAKVPAPQISIVFPSFLVSIWKRWLRSCTLKALELWHPQASQLSGHETRSTHAYMAGAIYAQLPLQG